MLKLEQINVFYGLIQALHSVSLEIPRGKIIALIGANGAGKTTLLNTIGGVLRPASGRLSWGATVIHDYPAEQDPEQKIPSLRGRGYSIAAHKVLGKGIALAPEGRRIFPDLTVSENLEMGGYLIPEKRVLEERMEEQYQLFPNLRTRSKQRAGSLSGGEQQMLCVARALMSRPELLLLDEPSLGLAPLIVEEIVQTIVQINRERQITVLLVEQNARLALLESEYTYVLENGRLTLNGLSADLLEDERVISAYLGS